ncbi:MAG: hypothetical protein KGL09_00955 [Pseudomonadota bacterium]|jgi:hypothetical protein|nr:hypothetical protein [Pseudomonadota bacterium]MDE3140362.1 hypothetical protein [Pseudomonadota bacterium]
MKARYASCVVASLLFATIAAAASNLNLSKSNIYRLTYSSELASPVQVQAMLAELDRMGPADAARLKQWLPANFRRFGIAGDQVKKVIVLPRDRTMKETGIVLLIRPEDEAAAIAVTVRGSKSNSSE